MERVKAMASQARSQVLVSGGARTIHGFAQWLPNWARNNFRTANGEPVKNVGVIKYISALISARGLLGQEVRLEYVKGHSGDRGNDGADAQANLGALKPVEPERDWEKAEKEVTRSAEEEHSASLDKPKPVPLQVVADELAQPGDPPRKVRKANHDLSFSRLPSASISTKPTSARSRSPPHVISPSPPPRIVEVSSSPPRGTQPSQVRPAPTAERTVPLKATVSSGSRNDQTTNGVSAQSSTRKSHRSAELVKTPIRRHGVGLFSTTPPPNAGFVKKFLPLPSASQRARELGLVLALPEDVVTPTKVTAMSVNAADVNLDVRDYLDCVDDDDVPFDDI
ncbi:hypothetical protein C0991_010050 [Blastosporella zonata]|nr:hypothetical protein C0991_010050 [Blastosporella zonata]